MWKKLLLAVVTLSFWSTTNAEETHKTAYDFSFTAIDGKLLPLENFKGKVILVVNTASRCGFTPQYSDLQNVWEKYRDKGFVVLGVPSNDFGGQEPGTEEEIKTFCEINYNINFPMTSKVTVKGRNAHPLYKWAGERFGFAGKPKWNFHKYLISADGILVDWFSTPTSPSSPKISLAIEQELTRVNLSDS